MTGLGIHPEPGTAGVRGSCWQLATVIQDSFFSFNVEEKRHIFAINECEDPISVDNTTIQCFGFVGPCNLPMGLWYKNKI